MHPYVLSHLADRTLLRELAALVAQERTTTAALLAHLAEVDERRLYLPAGYPSMFVYCVEELQLSEDAAFKRIRVARTARRFPAIFPALADGRLNLNAVVLLAPHLSEETADELLAAATHKSKSELEQLLAQRFPRPDLPPRLQAIAPLLLAEQLSPGTVEAGEPEHAPGRVEPPEQLAARPVAPAPRPRVAPLSPQKFALQLTIGQTLHDKLRYAQSLLSHQMPSGDIAQVLERGLDALIQKLERTKFAATDRPRPSRGRRAAGARHLPAAVKRAVWKRDQGQCRFVSETGQRCPARGFLEFDHVDPVARGGQATAGGTRLLCRAHNQYEAERTFGTAFMEQKRQAARRAAEVRKQGAAKPPRGRAEAEQDEERDVVPWLRALGCRADEARRLSEMCEAIPDAPLEERLRLALSSHGRARFRGLRRAANGGGTAT